MKRGWALSAELPPINQPGQYGRERNRGDPKPPSFRIEFPDVAASVLNVLNTDEQPRAFRPSQTEYCASDPRRIEDTFPVCTDPFSAIRNRG